MKDQCVILKLINGEEIVGIFRSETKKSYFISECYTMQYVIDPINIKNKAILVPYLSQVEKNDKGLEFSKTHVLHCCPVISEFEEFYIKTIHFMTNEEFDSDSSDSAFIYKNSSKLIH